MIPAAEKKLGGDFYYLSHSDEFNGDFSDRFLWKASADTWNYKEQNVEVSDGKLKIIATQEETESFKYAHAKVRNIYRKMYFILIQC